MHLRSGCKVNIFIENYIFPAAVGFTVSSANAQVQFRQLPCKYLNNFKALRSQSFVLLFALPAEIMQNNMPMVRKVG